MALSGPGCSQQESFEMMVNGLLSETVPQVRPDSCPADAVFLDARELEEYAVSHIVNAVHVGYDNFEMSSVSQIDRSATVVVYCSVGYRSEKIGEQLLEAGFQNVYNLYGGIFLWVNEGHPVVDESGATEKVHPYSDSWGKWLTAGEKAYE